MAANLPRAQALPATLVPMLSTPAAEPFDSDKHFFELGFSAGGGFLGIAVSLLGRNHPVGVVLAALFFGALSHGGLTINQRVPKELVDVLQAIVILLAICVQQVVERAARRMA